MDETLTIDLIVVNTSLEPTLAINPVHNGYGKCYQLA